MPSIGSETYRSSELPESATKETTVSDSHLPPEVIKGEDWPEAPSITSLAPETLDVPGPDREITVAGKGFNEESVIVWNNGDEVTEYVSDEELKTIVKPSTVEAPLPFELPVYVRNGSLKSNTVQFTFTQAEPEADHARSDKHHRRR